MCRNAGRRRQASSGLAATSGLGSFGLPPLLPAAPALPVLPWALQQTLSPLPTLTGFAKGTK